VSRGEERRGEERRGEERGGEKETISNNKNSRTDFYELLVRTERILYREIKEPSLFVSI
jgi:hypothetical protein